MRKLQNLFIMALFVLMSSTVIQAGKIGIIEKNALKLGGQMSNVRLMLETYAMIGIGIPYSKPEELLKKSMAEYESVLNSLEKEFKDEAIQSSIKRSRAAWKPVKEALLTASTSKDKELLKKEAQFVHDNIRSVIKELASSKKYLLQKAKLKNGDVLNASIEIGASARRLSSHYMMRLWKLPDPTIEKHWKNGLKIYNDSINTLKKSSFASDPSFKKYLDSTSRELRYFNMLDSMKSGHVPTLVHKKAEKVYREANEMSRIILSNSGK